MNDRTNNSEHVANVVRRWAETFIHRAMSDFSCYGRKRNLSLSQVGVLFQLGHGGSSSVSRIADNLGITPAAVSQMLDALVREGFVTRREDSRDRRMKQIELTDKGYLVLEEVMRAKERWFVSLVERMNNEERKKVVEGLEVLIEKAAKEEEDSKNDLNEGAGG